MDLQINLCHFIEADLGVEDKDELYRDYEDVFRIVGDGIIISNKRGSGCLFDADKHSEAVVKDVSLEDISNSYMEFYNAMSDILFFLDDNRIKHQVKFGVVTYHC